MIELELTTEEIFMLKVVLSEYLSLIQAPIENETNPVLKAGYEQYRDLCSKVIKQLSP